MLVAYDFRRYQPETIAFCQTAKSRNVRIVLFTDLELSPVADIADVVIPVTVETTTPTDTLAVRLRQRMRCLRVLSGNLAPRQRSAWACWTNSAARPATPMFIEEDHMKLSPIPPVDAPDGAYRERPIEPRKTALLSIDMQNAEWSRERMAKARVPGSPESKYLYIMEKIENS